MSRQKQQKIVQPPKTQKVVETPQINASKARSQFSNFYDFKIDQKKFDIIKQRTWKNQRRIFITGILFGFFTEYLLGNTKIYQNIVRKATMRRLNAKKKQDDIKEQKYQRKLQKESSKQKQKANKVV